MPMATGQTLRHYQLIEQIGEGGMGVVWKAIDTDLDRPVALKFLPDSLAEDRQHLARLEREARMVAALNHPNIVTIYSIEETEGRRFIVMELLKGQPLSKLIPAEGFSFQTLRDLAVPVIDALQAAHEAGIVHGDLKPSNIMVTDQGRVKVLDFGLAKAQRAVPPVATSQATTKSMNLAAGIGGTILYMSPEQIQGRPVGASSDIFCLGILLYEMATGQRPFQAATSPGLVAAVLRDIPRRPSQIKPGIPRQFDWLVDRCLAKDPQARPHAAHEVRSRLLAESQKDDPTLHERPVRSVAVMPFTDLSAEQDQGYFCDGVVEEIINAISHVEDLQVASRISSFQFKNTSLDSREIGDRLGVGTLLEGSVRKAGNHVRISASLVNAEDGYQFWVRTYERELSDIFAIQEGIAQSIVEALEVSLKPWERRAIKQVATADARAYDAYLRGRQRFRQFRRRSIESAAEFFARAIELDRNYAGAYAGLADCHSYLYMFWDVAEAHRREAETASLRAVALDPELAEAHVARGVAVSLSRQYEDAAKEFEEAIRLNPSLFEAYYFYARGYYARGMLPEAVSWFKRASQARPEDYQSPALLGSALAGLGRKEEAVATFRRMIDLAEKHLEVDPGDARALYLGAIAMCHVGGLERKSLLWAGRALDMDPEEPQVLYNVGCAYALQDRREEAIECLAGALAHGGLWKTWMKNDPDLASLHDDPRFQKMVA